jgi:ATP-dependent Clp protease ATP-binding subunit ClpC
MPYSARPRAIGLRSPQAEQSSVLMRTQTSPDLAQVLVEARDIAQNVGQPFSSTHLLLALFTVPNGAQVLLRDKGVTEDGILDRIQKLEREPAELVDTLVDRARTLASQAGMPVVDCLHLLVAIVRTRDIAAHRLLLATGVDLVALRNQAMSYLTGNMPRRVREATVPMAEEAVPEGRRSLRASEAAGARTTPGPVARGPLPSPPPLEARQRPASRGTDGPAEPPLPGDGSPTGAPPPASRDEGPGTARPPRGGRSGGTRRPATEPPPRDPDEPLGEYDLDPAEYPWLSALGRNLTQLAADGAIDPVIGRQREVEEVIDVLGKRRTNNPVLVGEPGVGKTAIVEGLAQALLELGAQGSSLGEKVVVELDMASVLAGTHLRGSFSEKLNGIKEEVKRAGGRIVVFIDELHTLIGAGATGEGPQDAANELKAALARGEFPCVGATTYDEYRKFIEQDSALERRFTPVLVAEPGLDDAVRILEGLIERYGDHHGVTYRKEALDAAVHLSARYVNDRCLPDKAIAIVDLAGSRARREGRDVVDAEAIARVISKVASVPEERLLMTDRERFLQMEGRLADRVVGHGDAIARIAQVIRRNYAGFDSRRPMGSFLFLGPTGVGKTETAKALAEFLFGSADALIRCDMSEYGEANTSARLIGAPPGYVGYGDGGQLTEPVRRRPFAVVLLDEVEKAHRDVLQLLLQVLDEGQLTDSRGRQVTFANTVVLMTSNLGSEVFTGPTRTPMGFGSGGDASVQDGRAKQVLGVAQGAFPPELWNRIDERLVFEPLSRDEVARIAKLLLDTSSRALAADKRISYDVADGVIPHLIDHGGYDPAFGARPMRQTIQRLVEAPLAERILAGEIASGDTVEVRLDGDALAFDRVGARRASR